MAVAVRGAKTAALLLADVAFKTGKIRTGISEYGPAYGCADHSVQQNQR